MHPPVREAGVVCGLPVEADGDEPLADEPADRRPHLEDGIVCRDPERLEQEAGQREEEEDAEEDPVADHVAPAVASARPARRAASSRAGTAQIPRFTAMIARPDDERRAEDVEEERVAEVEPAVPEVEAEHGLGEVVLEGEDRRADEEDQEAVEDEQVRRAPRAVAPPDPGVA